MTVRALSDLTLCGWRVDTEWPLPELLPWTGDDRPADITIRLGKVPNEVSGAIHKTPIVQVNEQGWLRYSIRGVATYLVRDGREIIIDTPHTPDTPDVALFLLGSVLGVVCHQRGLLPLHASCVSFGEHAIAFTGASGVGKSTVSACLVAERARLVSDDVTVIDVHTQGGPVVLPSFPRQKLWRETVEALTLAPGRRLRSTVMLDKFDVPLREAFRSAPVRLRGICELRGRVTHERPRLVPVSGLMAVRMLHRNIYRRRAATMLGFGNRMLRDSGSLARAISHHALLMPEGLRTAAGAGADLKTLLGVSA